MELAEFFNAISEHTKNMPSYLREGQKVYKVLAKKYPTNTKIVETKYKDKVDCYWEDSKTVEFIKASYDTLKAYNKL